MWRVQFQQPLLRRWGRTLPVGVGTALAALYAARPISDPDVWWLLASGSTIYEKRSVPMADPFSHTAAGAHWTHHSSLWELFVFGIWSIGGPSAIRVANVAFAVIIALVLWRLSCRLDAPRWFQVGTWAACLALAIPFVTWRPHVVSILFVFLWWPAIAGREPAPMQRRSRILRACITPIWASAHPFALMGIGFLALGRVVRTISAKTLIGDLSECGRNHWDLVEPIWLLLLTVINPIGLWLHFFVILGTWYSQHQAVEIVEWQPALGVWTDRIGQWIAFDLEAFGFVDVHIILCGCVVLYLCYEATAAIRSPQPCRLADLSLALAVLFLSLFARRFVWLMAYAVLLAACTLARRLRESKYSTDRVLCWMGTGLVAMVYCAFGYHASSSHALASNPVESPALPRDLCEWVADAGLEDRLYNPYHWGGYCIYRLYPRCHVFVDGRDHVYHRHDPTVFADAATIERGSPGVERVLDERRVDVVLIGRFAFARNVAHPPMGDNSALPTESVRPTLQRAPRGWTCVFINREGAVFVRQGSTQFGACAEYLASFGLDLSATEGIDPQVVLERSPEFALRYGMINEEQAEALRSSRRESDAADVESWILVGEALLDLTCPRGARPYFRRALEAAPDHPRALYGAARAAHDLGEHAKARALALRAFFLRPDDRATRALHQHMERAHRQ